MPIGAFRATAEVQKNIGVLFLEFAIKKVVLYWHGGFLYATLIFGNFL